MTFPPTAGGKLEQDMHYGSPEWAIRYNTLRNTIEGMNGIAKDGAYAALGDPSPRRIRGVAAQSLFAALLLMATNIAAIASFLRQARPDGRGTLRRPRRRRRTTAPLGSWTPVVAARSGAPRGPEALVQAPLVEAAIFFRSVAPKKRLTDPEPRPGSRIL